MEDKPEARELVVGFSDGTGDPDGEHVSFSLQTESGSHRYWMEQRALRYFVCYLLAVSEDVASKAGKLKPYGRRAERAGSPLVTMQLGAVVGRSREEGYLIVNNGSVPLTFAVSISVLESLRDQINVVLVETESAEISG
jgi:hypothetical protein